MLCVWAYTDYDPSCVVSCGSNTYQQLSTAINYQGFGIDVCLQPNNSYMIHVWYYACNSFLASLAFVFQIDYSYIPVSQLPS
jgi:hypothetical protein